MSRVSPTQQGRGAGPIASAYRDGSGRFPQPFRSALRGLVSAADTSPPNPRGGVEPSPPRTRIRAAAWNRVRRGGESARRPRIDPLSEDRLRAAAARLAVGVGVADDPQPVGGCGALADDVLEGDVLADDAV